MCFFLKKKKKRDTLPLDVQLQLQAIYGFHDFLILFRLFWLDFTPKSEKQLKTYKT